MKNKYLLLAITCVLIFMTACSTYESFNVSEGYSEYLTTPKAVEVKKISDNGSINLSILASEKCGCYLEKVNSKKEIKDDVAFQCIGFPIKTADPGQEIKQKVSEDNAKAYLYYVYDSYVSVAQMCMKKQLGAYFNQVNIDLNLSNKFEPSGSGFSMDYYCKKTKTDDQIIVVKLIAKSNDGKIIEGYGKAMNKMGNGHLAWMIPLGVATFPIGFAIGAAIFNNNFNALLLRTIAEAIDIAAADLSKKLATELAINPYQNFEILVLLE